MKTFEQSIIFPEPNEKHNHYSGTLVKASALVGTGVLALVLSVNAVVDKLNQPYSVSDRNIELLESDAVNNIEHVVQPGETIDGILGLYVPEEDSIEQREEELRALNGMEDSILIIGDTLLIPGTDNGQK